jgi:hypothetical protein
VVGVLFVVGWGAWLVSNNLRGLELEEPANVELSPEDLERGWRSGVEWQGIYLKGQKVGYIRLKKWREGKEYLVESDMTLQLTVMKTRQKIKTHTVASMDEQMVLRDFSMQVASGVARMDIRGQVQGKQVTLELDSAGSVQEQRIDLKEPPRLEMSLKPLLLREDLEVGQRVKMSFFDPTSMGERDIWIEYRGKEQILVMDQEIEAHHFVQTLAGTPLKLWTNGIGEVLREELPMGLVGIRESGAEARYGVTTGTATPAEDLVESVSVKAAGPMFPAVAPRATLELSGLNFEGLHLEGGRQSWTPAQDGRSGRLVLEPTPSRKVASLRQVTVDQVQAMVSGQREADPEMVAQLKAALSPEATVQSDHPQIRRRAESIASMSLRQMETAPVLDLAREVNAWAYREIEKKGVVGVPSALETLETMRGDCNEHATLVTALLRSLKVPARLAVGIAYLPERQRFFYHAWVEVWAGQWVAIDPTFGQLPADVGHVRFVVGGLQEQFEMFRVIGQLRMEHLPNP